MFDHLDFEKPIFELRQKISALKASQDRVDLSDEIKNLDNKCTNLTKSVYENLSDWQIVKVARHPRRLYFLDYVEAIFDDFIEMHGDRHFADDRALIGGIATFQGQSVMLIGNQKGRDTKDKIVHNFGMPKPEGYRKALRLMKIAERFLMPVITFIDTPGAYPGIGAEERNQSEAIAQNLKDMAMLKVPTIGIVIGEGGSGGALAISVVDRLFMLQYSIYATISPEGCASILWKDAKYAAQAAETMRLTAKHLQDLKLIDGIIEEPLGGVHSNPKKRVSWLVTILNVLYLN